MRMLMEEGKKELWRFWLSNFSHNTEFYVSTGSLPNSSGAQRPFLQSKVTDLPCFGGTLGAPTSLVSCIILGMEFSFPPVSLSPLTLSFKIWGETFVTEANLSAIKVIQYFPPGRRVFSVFLHGLAFSFNIVF